MQDPSSPLLLSLSAKEFLIFFLVVFFCFVWVCLDDLLLNRWKKYNIVFSNMIQYLFTSSTILQSMFYLYFAFCSVQLWFFFLLCVCYVTYCNVFASFQKFVTCYLYAHSTYIRSKFGFRFDTDLKEYRTVTVPFRFVFRIASKTEWNQCKWNETSTTSTTTKLGCKFLEIRYMQWIAARCSTDYRPSNK